MPDAFLESISGISLDAVLTDEISIKDSGIGHHEGDIPLNFEISTAVMPIDDGRLICFLRIGTINDLVTFAVSVRAQYMGAESINDEHDMLKTFYSVIALPALHTQLARVAQVASSFAFNSADFVPPIATILELVEDSGVGIVPVQASE